MYEISHESTKKDWVKMGDKGFVPQYIDVVCPGCGHSLSNAKMDWHSRHRFFAYSLKRCVICNELLFFFLLNPPESKDSTARKESTLFMYPEIEVETDIDSKINELSPRFNRIYKQALTAENEGLDEIAGMGHRKALEFLLRDYAKDTYKDKADSIDRTNTIGSVIHNFLAGDHPKLAIAAERAAWLGNDETHYRRDWKDKDLQDLKTLLALVISEVESQLLLRDLPEEMPDPKKQKGQ